MQNIKNIIFDYGNVIFNIDFKKVQLAFEELGVQNVEEFYGHRKQDAVFDTLGQGDDAAGQGRVCEANFYVGEWLLQHHDPAAARPLIQKAASDCPLNFVEWGPAQSELAQLKQ